MNPHRIAALLYLMLPIIFAGVCNMIYVKLPIHRGLKRPIDGNKILSDGRRLFGDNKTWKGFIGMIVFSAAFFSAQAGLWAAFAWAKELSLVPFGSLGWPFLPPICGALWGSGYVLFELPNSFMKRRIGIEPGTNLSGARGFLFGFIDQADSVIGCLLALFVFYRFDPLSGLMLLAIGIGIHYLVNVGLFFAKLKKQAA